MRLKAIVPKPLTKANVLMFTDEGALLRYYVPEFRNWNTKIRSNLRSGDNTPSLVFSHRNGKCLVSDFGSQHVGMSVFDYLQLLLGLSYLQLLERMRVDFRLPLAASNASSGTIQGGVPEVYRIGHIMADATFDIRFRSRDMFSWRIDEEYWYGRYGITKETLAAYNVKAVEWWELVTDGAPTRTTKPTPVNPSYVYVPDKSLNVKGWKRVIYSPLHPDKKLKWRKTIPRDVSLGLHMLPEKGDTLLIETSLKDAMVIDTLYRDEDVWATDLFAEYVFLSEPVLADLRKRFRRLIIHGDGDDTGLRQAKMFSEQYNLPYFCNPAPPLKDTSDMRHLKGANYTKTFIKKHLDAL